MTALKQGSDAWLAHRRQGVYASDLPIILGLSPYKSEATLAREKLGEVEPQQQTLPMRVGLALEPVIAEEYERQTGAKLRRFHGVVMHPTIPWAGASPDWRRVGEKRLVEGKTSSSRRWDGDEVPDDVQAQVQWQLGVMGWPLADVALLARNELRVWTIEADANLFTSLVAIATDFRYRLAAGGPFSEDAASVKARYPADDGSMIEADAELNDAVVELLRLRALRRETTEAEERIETAVKMRMAEHTRLQGNGWAVTWKRAKDSELTDWRLVADGLLRQLPQTERDALVGLHSTVREGARYFRVQVGKGDSE